MCKTDKEKGWMAVLSAIIICGTFYIYYLVFNKADVSGEQSKLAYLVIGYTSALSQAVVGYYFFSSKGSRDKDALIKKHLTSSQKEEIDERK